MTKVVFLTRLIPNEIYNEVLKKSHNNMQDAANALQWNIYEGFRHHYGGRNLSLINVMPVGSFPQFYDDAFVNRGNFTVDEITNNINVGFCNIKFIKNYSITENVYKELINAFSGEDEGVLYLYTIAANLLEAVAKLKKHKPNIKVCAIIADLPEFCNLSKKNNFAVDFYIKHVTTESYKLLYCVDAFVLLTKQMAERLKINKPYCVVEGIAKDPFKEIASREKTEYKTVLYTGTLHKRFGVLNLVEAMRYINDSNIRLILCGSGDSENEIIEACKNDKRINFLGQLPRNKVLELQMEATLLVNPRQNSEEYTKYSFPSKIMEYLASGTPVVGYKLDGIPEEYDKYIIYVKDNSIRTLANTLEVYCYMNEKELSLIGKRGREFVLNEKNCVKQCEKIINYCFLNNGVKL